MPAGKWGRPASRTVSSAPHNVDQPPTGPAYHPRHVSVIAPVGSTPERYRQARRRSRAFRRGPPDGWPSPPIWAMLPHPVRTRYDQFGKDLLEKAFAPAAAVETEAEVTAERRRIDVWVLPDPARGAALDDLGVLGTMARVPSTFELCHRTPSGEEVAALIYKHGDFRHMLSLRDPAPPLPTQWVISSGRPEDAIAGLCFKKAEGWPRGVYAGPGSSGRTWWP